MTKRKTFSLIGLVLSIYLIINMLFIPFVGGEPLWEIGFDHFIGIIMLVELVLGIIALILQLFGLTEKADFVHFGNGFYFSYHLYVIIEYFDNDVMDRADIGLWLGLIASFALLMVIFVAGFVSNDKKAKASRVEKDERDEREIVGYDPKTGKPIYKEEKKIVRYDTKTGKPIYEEEKKPIKYDSKTGKPIYEEERKILRYDTETGEPIYEEKKEKKILRYDSKTGEPIYEE